MEKHAVVVMVAALMLLTALVSWRIGGGAASKDCENKIALWESKSAGELSKVTADKDSCMIRLDECRKTLVERALTTVSTTISTTSIPDTTTSIKSKGYGTPIPIKPVENNESETRSLLCFANKTIDMMGNKITQTVEVDCTTGEPVY